MKHTTRSGNNIQELYGQVILLCCLVHVIYTIIFISLSIFPLIIYNVFSCAFYIGLYRLIQRSRYSLAIVLVHLEISIFTIVSCCYLGWDFGFSIYLISMAIFVYFNPFKRKYIPYLFSFYEIIVFIFLRIYTINYKPMIEVAQLSELLVFIFNSLCCFAVILFISFSFKVTANLIEETLTQDNSRLQDMVDHDSLTHLWSRPYFIENFKTIASTGNNIVLTMADIDDFKAINDTYGHECGDYILSELSNIIRSMCPVNSGICRWGGEEFIILFHGYGSDHILSLIEDIRCKVAAFPFSYHNNRLHITMTFGVSTSSETRDMQELIRLSDNRMYFGKRNGKNRIITSDTSEISD